MKVMFAELKRCGWCAGLALGILVSCAGVSPAQNVLYFRGLRVA